MEKLRKPSSSKISKDLPNVDFFSQQDDHKKVKEKFFKNVVIELNQDDNKSQISQKSRKLDPIKKTVLSNITTNNILLGRNKDLLDLSEKSSVHSKKLAPLKQTSVGVGVDYSNLLNVAKIEEVRKKNNFYEFESSNFLENFKTQKKVELTSLDQTKINKSDINSYFKSDKIGEEDKEKKLSTNKKSNIILSYILFQIKIFKINSRRIMLKKKSTSIKLLKSNLNKNFGKFMILWKKQDQINSQIMLLKRE